MTWVWLLIAHCRSHVTIPWGTWKLSEDIFPLFYNHWPCIHLLLHWLLQFTVYWTSQVMLVLPPVAYELSSQAHCSSPSLLPHIYLHDWCLTLVSCYLSYPIQGTVLSHQSLTGSSYKIHLRPNVQTCLFCPLQSANQFDLLVLRAKPAIAQHCAFTIVGPSMWNDTPQKFVVSF